MAKRKKAVDPGIVVAYTRVSTEEQAASHAGLDAQQASIEAEVARRGWTLVETFCDAGVSGKSIGNRAALTAALTTVESGCAGTLVVAKLDRLSRSLLDFAELMARAQRNAWNLVALDLGIDLSTPAGEFMASVMASAAQWERRIIGQRTKDALAARKAAGVRLGRPSDVPVDVLNRIANARAMGRSLRGIAADLTAAGVPTIRGGAEWSSSSVAVDPRLPGVQRPSFCDRLNPAILGSGPTRWRTPKRPGARLREADAGASVMRVVRSPHPDLPRRAVQRVHGQQVRRPLDGQVLGVSALGRPAFAADAPHSQGHRRSELVHQGQEGSGRQPTEPRGRRDRGHATLAPGRRPPGGRPAWRAPSGWPWGDERR